ncbi:hypothetical protein J2X84_001359 [Pseudomonas corrugata]|uniref:hypothetical protein n=1 Tax=Pseudomonas corrugata TaxID=47879 RepID=UPI002864F6DD|nr:hypothetical protein [Pseudomonas corrugata]MDR7282538.1 hypothetical protein [Pseudomonas corrugata]
MSYPQDTEYKGYIIRKHDPAFQANSYQGFRKNGEQLTQFCATEEDVKRLIISDIVGTLHQ